MCPEALLPLSVRGDVVVPRFLGSEDHPWLRLLLDECARFGGQPRRLLDERWREPSASAGPPDKRRLAIHVLGRLTDGREQAAVAPRRARGEVFREAAGQADAAGAVLARVAARLAVTPAALGASLFGDLPGERLVLPPAISPGELALEANLLLAQGLLFRSTSVRIALDGNARAVVRLARLRGLLCVVSGGAADDGAATLEVSGPLALFRRTLVYGRRLAELLPVLAWSQRFRLRAACVLRGRALTLELATGDPIRPGREPKRFDSRLEERFARDFGRIALDWDLVREPEPVPAAGTLVFPDFSLQHRATPARRWLLEIVGFWTQPYLFEKLERLRAARLPHLILCVDEERNLDGEELPAHARLVRFRRRIDAAAVLRVIEGTEIPER